MKLNEDFDKYKEVNTNYVIFIFYRQGRGEGMSGKMIMFDNGIERFQLRAAGVALKDNKVLIYRAEKDQQYQKKPT